MLKSFERAGERILSLFVPRATAGAYRRPQTYCEWCDSGRTRWVSITANCSVSYSSRIAHLCA